MLSSCRNRCNGYEQQNAEEELDAHGRPTRISLSASWRTVKLIAPYFWPRGMPGLKVRLVLCFILMVGAKVVNLFIPRMFQEAVNWLNDEGSPGMPTQFIVGYAALRLLASGMSESQNALFLNVSQHATRLIATKTFRHLHSLSLGWHLKRKTGAVLRTIDRGTSSVTQLLRILLFTIFPTALELVMVCILLSSDYGFIFAVITFFTIAIYVVDTFSITAWRKKFRRKENEADNACSDLAVDSLLNFETVKYFTAEEHEVNRYQSKMFTLFGVQIKSRLSLMLLNVSQQAVIAGGLMAALLVSANHVVSGEATVGELFAIQLYIMQLSRPLSWLGSAWTLIVQAFIDMEKMFEIMDQPNDVSDDPDATELEVLGGEIVFDDVRFSYGDNQVIKGVSFTIPANGKVALVGDSGGGKSSLGRLLCRFYDPDSGAIRIDGQDIRHCTQQSLRQHIGVVPQDTVLFNDTIGYNISYGAAYRGVTQEEIEAAAEEARIHNFINNSPEGYETRVGERGLRLSGGEKQRVAIARVILKNPKILLLDEATSALDTRTEREIQEALYGLSKGRSTLIIAHRLSTIKDCDQIIVLKKGKIAERGTHEELLAQHGEYYELWTQQREVDTGSEGGSAIASQEGGGASALEANNDNNSNNGQMELELVSSNNDNPVPINGTPVMKLIDLE